MTAALLWTLGALVFAAEIVAIVVLIARDGKPFPKLLKRRRGDGIETKAERDARLAEPLHLPPAREDLAGDAVEEIHIGRPPTRVPGATITAEYGPPNTEQRDAPPLEFVERLAQALEPAGSPWARPIDAELTIAAAQRAEAGTGWGGYRPRHARQSGPITQAFEAITAQFAADEPTTEIAVRAA